MRVLFLTKYYPPVEGGIERYGHTVCTDLNTAGTEMVVVAAAEERHTSRVETIDGVVVHRLDSNLEFSSTPITFDLPRLLRSIAPTFDLIHINFPNPWTDLLFLALCRRRKVILTYHSDIFRPKGSLSGLLLKIYSPVIRQLLARVSAVIASSPDCIQNSPFLSRHPTKCRVIPMPVDVASLERVDSDLVREERQRFGKFILFVGRLVTYKGLRYLIEAIERVPDARLVIVGRGPLESELKGQVDRLGVGDRVHFSGKISEERLKALYHACRCFVLPSISHAEGFGMVLAEAMACGKPVISTQLNTGTSFVNLDGISGYVVPPKDSAALAAKIEVLLYDESACIKLGQQAKERAEKHFDRPIVVRETLRLYEEVLAGGGKRADD
jgi:glycosyltransferase involved in cell wall biosynthesis